MEGKGNEGERMGGVIHGWDWWEGIVRGDWRHGCGTCGRLWDRELVRFVRLLGG